MASEATAVATGSRAPRFISFDSDGGKIDASVSLLILFCLRMLSSHGAEKKLFLWIFCEHAVKDMDMKAVRFDK